ALPVHCPAARRCPTTARGRPRSVVPDTRGVHPAAGVGATTSAFVCDMTEGSKEDSASVARLLVMTYMSEAGFRASPGAFLEELPVRHPVLDVGPIWMVSGYDEITSLLGRNCLRTAPELGNVRLQLAESAILAERYALTLPMRDGDDHRRLRAITQPAFTRKRIEAMKT